MTTFHPPADADRCRAIVMIGGQRGRCRAVRVDQSDLCVYHKALEDAQIHMLKGAPAAFGRIPRVPEPKERRER